MPFAQIKRSKRLRVRLAVWYGGAFAALIVAATFIVYEGLRFELVEETDFRLLEDAKETAQAVAQYYPNPEMVKGMLARKADNHTHERLFLQWLDVDGTVLWAGRETPSDLSDLSLDEEGVFRVHEVGVFRVAQRKVTAPNVPRYVVRVGASQEQINAVVWKRTRIMILVGATTMIIAILGAYWLAGSAIQPLTMITRTADRLRPAHLDERLPIRGTGDELDHLSRTINRFLDRIGDYLAKNREFVANAAHELRSPLAAIRSSVDVALNADRTPEEYQSLLVVIADECAHLTTVVNQLLQLAESDAGRGLKHSESLRLDRLVDTSVEMFRGAAEEREIRLEWHPRVAANVVGNSARIRQVINNLLDNALKFTPRGGWVRVDLETASGGDMVLLRVSDSGIGIAEHDLSHVFERFYRCDKGRDREGGTRGTGLGLAITRSVVEEHGGTISVQSTFGRGTTFTVTLPADKGQAKVSEDSDSNVRAPGDAAA
jgi:heavy metal sensor kinase